MSVSVGGEGEALRQWKTPWRTVLVALGLAEVGTLVLGGLLFSLQQNVWWIAAGGILALLVAGVYLGRAHREPEPLYGALLGICYFGLVAAVLFGGTLAEALPEPLPGLEHGDSTFFFVWPLLQLAAAVAGSVAGGRWATGKRRQGGHIVPEDLRRRR